MPFGTITVNTKSYAPRDAGVYVLSTAQFGDPLNEFRLRPGTKNKAGATTTSVTRLFQKDVTVGSAVERRQAIVTLNVAIPSVGGITTAEVDGLASDISEFITQDTLSRLLQGEA